MRHLALGPRLRGDDEVEGKRLLRVEGRHCPVLLFSYHHTMSNPPDLSLSDWNWAVLMLTQAMIAEISSNFRMVILDFADGKWVVRVTLREDSSEDREAIDDVCDQFSIHLEDVRDRVSKQAYAEIVCEVIVSQAPIFLGQVGNRARPIFRMRES